MDMFALLAAATVMAAIVVALLALYSSTAAPRADMERRLGTVLGADSGFESSLRDVSALRPTRTGSLPLLGSLEGKAWTEELANKLESADIGLTVSEFLSLRVFLALIAAVVPVFMLESPLNVLGAIGAGALAFILPGFYVGFARGRRVKKLNDQLPDALTMLSASLKAGFGIMQSMDLASRELEHPIASELRRALRDINVGQSTESALTAMAKRSGSGDLDIVVTAMLIQQSTGGNLAEILDNVAHTMRERIRIRGEIATLTSQQMLTGIVIGALPFAMVVLFSITTPGYMTPLFVEPTGRLMLVGAGILEFIGIMLIKKILAIEV